MSADNTQTAPGPTLAGAAGSAVWWSDGWQQLLVRRMAMTDEQIEGMLAGIRRRACTLHGEGYHLPMGVPTGAALDVQWLLAHVDGLKLRIADLEAKSPNSGMSDSESRY